MEICNIRGKNVKFFLKPRSVWLYAGNLCIITSQLKQTSGPFNTEHIAIDTRGRFAEIAERSQNLSVDLILWSRDYGGHEALHVVCRCKL